MMEITLRPERPEDYRETENVTREAFWNQYSPGCSEHYLLHIMRGYTAFIPELDVVAAGNGRIVGNAVCLKAVIRGNDGNDCEVLSLGPISVLPEYQRRGVGGKLIEYIKKTASEMGFRAILLCGDPDYYSRQGFIPAERLGIRTADDFYAAALQVCELYEHALPGAGGCYIEDPIYEVAEAAAEAFDQGFVPKVKVSGTPMQKRFEEVAAIRKHAL